MTLVLHDSGRVGKLKWAETAVQNCGVKRLILSPFETPPVGMPRRPSASDCVKAINAVGGEVLLDPTTHALTSVSNKTGIYDMWQLWSGNDRTSDAALIDHVQRWLACHASLSVSSVVPTLALVHPTGDMASAVLKMMEEGLRINPSATVSIAGTPGFWNSGGYLDAMVGEVAQLRPKEVVLTVVHDSPTYPVALGVGSLHGICRTTHSFSIRSLVTIGYGDLAGLPAAVAGATYLGTGWDLTQRRFSQELSIETTSGGGGAVRRYTHEGLVAVLKEKEAQQLAQLNPGLSQQLLPGKLPPDIPAMWQAHLATLAGAMGSIQANASRRDRYKCLRALYDSAAANFPSVIQATPLAKDHKDWIEPFRAGLDAYAAAEGF